MREFGGALAANREPQPVQPRQLPGTDFYCLRFRVWYSSVDCAVRTKYKTCNGCLRCDQGRFNLKRHATALLQVGYAFRAVD